jgi:hypothetical protein
VVDIPCTLNVASAGERCRIGHVLLSSAVEQILADVEDKGGNSHDQYETAREDNEDLTALFAPPVNG